MDSEGPGTVDLSDEKQVRHWVETSWLPSVTSGMELHALLLSVRGADEVSIDMDNEGVVEWLNLKFDGGLFSWNPDDDWDDIPPFNEMLVRMDSAIHGALIIAGIGK